MFKKYSRTVSFIFIFIIVFLILSLWQPDKFLSLQNFQSMGFQIPEFGLLALAMTLAILTGGIDLSIINITILSGILGGYVFNHYITAETKSLELFLIIFLAIVVVLISSIICGTINGLLIGSAGISPILVTLGTSRLFAGIALVITNGGAVTNYPSEFIYLGNGTLWMIPLPFIVFIMVSLLTAFFLNKTKLGFNIYMLGTNPVAAIFAGINNKIVLIKTYAITGLLSGIAAIIVMSRTNSIKVGYGSSYLLQTVLVAILGGVNPSGGFGAISGVVLGIILLQIISSGFNIIGFSAFFRNVIWGSLLLFVMVVTFFISKYQSQQKLK